MAIIDGAAAGGTSDAASVGAAAGTDMTETNEKLGEIVEALSVNDKAILRDIAIKLYSNCDFDHTSESADQIAIKCIERARILLKRLS